MHHEIEFAIPEVSLPCQLYSFCFLRKRELNLDLVTVRAQKKSLKTLMFLSLSRDQWPTNLIKE